MTPEFNVRLLLQDDDYQEYTEFLEARKNSTIFHTIEWKNVLEDTFNYKPIYLLVKGSEGALTGICPAFLVKTLFGSIIVSQPFFEYGGPLIADGFEGAYKDVLKYYKNVAESNHIKYIEIRGLPHGENEYQSYDEFGYVKQLKAYDYYIDIGKMDYDKDVWHGLYNNKVRNSIRKGIKNGVEIVEENNIEMYYDLYLKTMARLGSPTYPKALFENIHKYCKSLVRFTLAYSGDVPIAGLWSFCYKNRISIVGNVSSLMSQEYNANDVLYNELIEYATTNGFEIIDFGRTRPNSSYEKYKKKWGATKVDLYSHVYPPNAAKSADPYKYYLIFSRITKKVPWMFTKTKIGPFLMARFP